MIAYFGALAVLLAASFWQLDTFTGQIVKDYSLDNFRTLSRATSTTRSRCGRCCIAAAVTVTDAIVAFPIAFTWPRCVGPRARALLLVAVLMPLWSSYLVKVYAWRIILAENGILNWMLEPFGLERPGLRQRGHLARLLVPLAAVHDPADLRRPGAHPRLAARGLQRPGRARPA